MLQTAPSNDNVNAFQPEHAIDIDESEGSIMPEFFEEVGHIKTLISLIRSNIRSIQGIYNKQAWDPIESQKNTKELDTLLESTNSTASQIRTRLNKMKQDNDNLPPENSQKKTRTTLHSTLLKKFLEIGNEYASLQGNYKDRFRERIERQAQIIKPGVTKEEIELMMNGTDMFSDQILIDDRQGNAKNALINIQEQQRDLRQLEMGFQELNQLFIELKAQIELSSENIVSIQSDISKSVQYNQQAITDVSKAEEYAAQKKRRIVILTSSIVTVVLIALVIAAVIVYNEADITI